MAKQNNTDMMIQMFAKDHHNVDPGMNRRLQIVDVLFSCFPSEAPVLMQSVLDYREKIHDTEEQFRLLRIRYEGDNYAFNQRWAQVDKTRSIYHNAAIKAAAALNGYCDQLHIDHLFVSDTSESSGARTVIGEEMIALAEAITEEEIR